MTKSLALIFTLLFIMGCSTTPEQKFESALNRANQTSFDDRPALYRKQLNRGLISQATFDNWMSGWKAQDEERKKVEEARRIVARKEAWRQQREYDRWMASLTPAQKLDLEMRQREIQAQQAQMMYAQQRDRQEAVQNSLNNLQQSLQRQQEINAYNSRTQALSQPQNINVYHGGAINHNVRVSPFPY